MNVSDVFDWTFFWQMFRNFMASVSPFVMVPVAIICAGLLVYMIIGAIKQARS